jgi:ubiquinone/menaquinone biosynthesis C-methylase UbiE
MNEAGHSEAHFGAYRDFWWNSDFLSLCAARLDFQSRRRVLDVGCGVGHWSRAIAPFLTPGTQLTAVDPDPKWSQANPPWLAQLRDHDIDARVLPGDAMALPFADASFDFVTCQTVLIHVPDAAQALGEMVRVLAPGGLLLCVEPDNLGACTSRSSCSDEQTLEQAMASFGFQLAVERGRRALRQGDHSVGGLLPGLFAGEALRDIDVRLSDNAMPLYPPYEHPGQRALLEAMQDWSATDSAARAETFELFCKGGGDPARFDEVWLQFERDQAQLPELIESRRLTFAGGALMYMVSGYKV